MQQKLISIILPVYNGEKYLAQATQSILNQTYPYFELIIINDGSKDHSEAIALDIQRSDSRVVYIKNEKNIGLIQTLNHGFQAARGDYIARMDQDDIAHPKRLEIQLKYLEKLGKPALVGSNILVIDNRNKIIKIPRKMHQHDSENTWVKYRKCPVHHPTVMMSREIAHKFQPFYLESDLHTEDYAAWLRVNTSYPILNIKKVLLFYRVHTTNISTVYFNAQTNQMLKRLHSFYLENLKLDMSIETLRTLLFLQLSPQAEAHKTFEVILSSGKAFIERFGDESFVKKDIAYSVFSIGLKSYCKNLPVATYFIIGHLGVRAFLSAVKQTGYEGLKSIILKPFLSQKYAHLLNQKTSPATRNF